MLIVAAPVAPIIIRVKFIELSFLLPQQATKEPTPGILSFQNDSLSPNDWTNHRRRGGLQWSLEEVKETMHAGAGLEPNERIGG